jgi:GT2 family glycosyltransferase
VFRAIDAAHLCGEVWVVDNASTDGSVQAVREQFVDKGVAGPLSFLHLIASPINLWFGGGQNVAMSAMGFSSVTVPQTRRVPSTGRGLPRYVLVLNPDTLVREGALGEMVRFMDHSPSVGVWGPRLVYGDGRFQHSAYRFPSLAQIVLDFWPVHWRLVESRLNGRFARRLYEAGEPFVIDHPLGAAMLFRREVIEQTGGFDLAYQMYVEEIDWCMRVKRAGWEAYCVPRAEVVHYEGQSTRQVRPDMVVALWRSRYRFFASYHLPLYRGVVRCLVRAGMRDKIRRVRDDLDRGDIDEATAISLIEAYRQVIELGRVAH